MMTIDAYHTPTIVVEACIQRAVNELALDEHNSQYILDPGAGYGAWGIAARRRWPQAYIAGVELRNCPHAREYDEWHEANFMTWRNEREFDLVLGNPPFSMGEQFINVSLSHVRSGGHVCVLLRLAYLETTKRYMRFWRVVPIKHVAVLVQRPSFMGGGVDMAAYGYFMFQRDYIGPATISWIDWKGTTE